MSIQPLAGDSALFVFSHRQDNWASRSYCSARCAWRMSRAVFLSAQPCFQGLQRPQADDLRALILRWVSLVFTGVLNDAACGAALFLGHAAFVVWPQVPPPFGRGHQGVFAFVRHDSRQGRVQGRQRFLN